MGTSQAPLIHSDQVVRFKVGKFDYVTGRDFVNPPNYAEVWYDHNSGVVVKWLGEAGGEDAIFLSGKNLAYVPEEQLVNYKAVTRRRFFWFKLKNDRGTQLLYGGLLLAVAGTLIDGLFAIGKLGIVLVWLSPVLGTSLATLALSFKVIGLYLTSYRTYSDGK